MINISLLSFSFRVIKLISIPSLSNSCLHISSDHAIKRFLRFPSRRNVEPLDQGVPNAPKVQPQGEVTNAEFRDAIWMLSQVVVPIKLVGKEGIDKM